MTPKLKISENLIQRLQNVKEDKLAALYGLMYDGTLLVVGMSVEVKDTSFPEFQSHFPTEVDFCGIVTFNARQVTDLTKKVVDNLMEVIVSDNPLLLKRVYIQSNSLQAFFYVNQKLVEVEFDVMKESEICELFVHIRLKTQLPLICELSSDAIFDSINELQKKVSSGSVAFHISKTKVYLFGTEMESTSPSVGSLFKSIIKDNDEVSVAKKQIKPLSLKDISVMNISMMQKCTYDRQNEIKIRSAPVIHHIRCTESNNMLSERLKVILPIDALSMVHHERRANELYNILVDSLCRSLRLLERNLSRGPLPPTMPTPYHFNPLNFGHFFTIVYPQLGDKELTSVRSTFHEQLIIRKLVPIFRKGNAHEFKVATNKFDLLVNPHEGLPPSGVKDGEEALVQGRYSYHHYMQDCKDDSGWGCAYRSLQTLVSWLRWQGYTTENVPTHEQIQQCLVDIGDKDYTFVGSTKWIGSNEVCYCLDSMFGVTSHIMYVASGEELSEKGSELLLHFKTQGTPIMIGGGVLAHTIVGIDYNKQTGDIKFLVVDPHYSGSEDLKSIQSKGWVGWKKVSFWDKKSFYNLCMPIRPVCI